MRCVEVKACSKGKRVFQLPRMWYVKLHTLVLKLVYYGVVIMYENVD